MKFSKYPIADDIKRSLASMGFHKPTDIQYRAIPSILKGEDVLAIAQTGTGKTAAFAIPIIDGIYKLNRKIKEPFIKALVLVPTRELAVQIDKVFATIGRHSGVKSMALYGGKMDDGQQERLERGIDVLVATPGRLFDFVYQKHIDLRKIKYFVIDEADHMLDLGFIKDIQDVITLVPDTRQTMFFSATINETLKKLAYSVVNNPVRIQISPKDPVSKNVSHYVLYVPMDDKRFYLERIVRENPETKILVFVRTKVRAERVVKAMHRVGIKSMAMHGDVDQRDREAVMKSYAAGEVILLVATDVTARGIDVPGVGIVINYDLPEYTENYVHRVGRTGRGREKGLAFSFCAEHEEELLHEIQGFIGKPIEVLEVSNDARQEILDLTKEQDMSMDDIAGSLEEIKSGKRAKRKKKSKW